MSLEMVVLEYDAGWTDLSQSLMSIKKTLTASQRQMTFTAGRSGRNRTRGSSLVTHACTL